MAADSQALRARRSRRHKAGDHSLCKPDSFCRAGASEPTLPNLPPVSTAKLGSRGADLWQQMRTSVSGPLQVALLLEACRIADRLDTLDRQLHGEAWLRFRHHESDVEVTVYVDRVLAEAREQATAFRGIVAELSKSSSAPKPAESTGGGGLADLTAKIAERRASAKG